jgi:oxygen-independent coproporphyrinogen-3 oxidase
VTRHFTLADDAEVAIEVDPDVTTVDQLELLADLGFNRLSIGVQDFDPRVLAAIRRDLSYERTAELLDAARRSGFGSVNVDLVYGLPHQEPEQFARTIEQVIALGPERVALYSFAYVPWIRPNQKRLDQSAMPDRETKFALFAGALRQFLAAGYLQVGMDHFVEPDDEMGRAVTNRTLYRNFMGYTVHRASDMLGVGVSSIGALEGAFAQNVKDTPAYEAALDAGELPIERGYALDDDDRIRQRVITELMCNFHLDRPAIERELGIEIDHYFAAELEQLTAPGGPVEQGFVELSDDALAVSPLGRLFIRNVCMIFDRYLAEKTDGKPVFSRTV